MFAVSLLLLVYGTLLFVLVSLVWLGLFWGWCLLFALRLVIKVVLLVWVVGLLVGLLVFAALDCFVC